MEVVQTLQRYSKYKESRESWLGEIPEHWEEKKFKHVFSEKKKTTNIELNCGSISFGKVVYKDDEKVPESTKKSYQVLSKGDFLINPLNLNYDLISLRIALSDKDVVVSSGYIILHENLKLNKEYYKWLLHIFDVVYMKTLGSGVRQTLSFTHIANCELVFPPLEEQNKMAEFLENKTTKIDQAIGIKQKQIELLKERRQIVIHKAVTRGLNDKVKLKDSGVEWIEEIPEHWDVKRLKYVCILQRGHDLPKEQFKQGVIPVYGSNGIIGFHNKSTTKGPSIIVGRSGSAGSVNFVNQDFWAHNTSLYVKESYGNDWKYLYNLLSIIDIKMIANGSAVPTLDRRNVHQVLVAYPEKEEQKQIVKFIETVYTKIANAISLKEKEIEKLKEYKMSLIDGVVTGKVKVS